MCRIAQQRAKILENTANYVKIVSKKGERRRKVCSAKKQKKPLDKRSFSVYNSNCNEYKLVMITTNGQNSQKL